MEIPPLMKLHLRAPLFYSKISSEEGESILNNSGDEFLFCYKLNLQQSKSIEPDKELFLDSFEFAGRAPLQPQKSDLERETDPSQIVSLPQGVYLFMQQRSNQPLSQAEWLDLAIEQQKDGLWERNKLDTDLYVRFLHEDGAFVTQVIRRTAD